MTNAAHTHTLYMHVLDTFSLTLLFLFPLASSAVVLALHKAVRK